MNRGKFWFKFLHKLSMILVGMPICVIYKRAFDYKKINKSKQKHTKCPFCDLENLKKEKMLIKENPHTIVVKNLYPYFFTKDHILILPKRHIRTWEELNDNELKEIKNLISYYLEKKYILLGRHYPFAGASQEHLHIHLILSKERDK